ncbi:hypothetical protein K474DRAFT_1591034 [Panus rudis PR-1116 ss-1]|nr:hypothetical protein K474DRAFT_1591034 [Panus rudis PR-1116 ss-1]
MFSFSYVLTFHCWFSVPSSGSDTGTDVADVDRERLVYNAPPSAAVGTVVWAPCPSADDIPGSECGSIAVPKDYFNASAGTAKLAVARLRAPNSPSKGTVFVNPGGPGGRGKQLVSRRGDVLRNIIGNHYDILGFDPRGIGETEPTVKCFGDDYPFSAFARNTVLRDSYNYASNLSLEEIKHQLVIQQRIANALLQTQFHRCAETMGDELRYMGTPTVVRDIDFMTSLLDGNEALIHYWGGSYGSILGQYLVNMGNIILRCRLPDRVGRVVIDAIADASLWSSQPHYKQYRQWLSSTDDAYDRLVSECFKAGPQLCALAQVSDVSPLDIKTRIEEFHDSLYYQPLPVPHAIHPGILTSGRARQHLLVTLERVVIWPESAHALAEAMKGNGAPMLDFLDSYSSLNALQRTAVSCNDAPPFDPPASEEIVEEFLDVYQNVSHFVIPVVTDEPDSGCQYWPVSPPERFIGPWNHTLRNPMLVISNTADPVTPIASGQIVDKLLGNSSRLLVLDSPGHGTLSVPSLCVVQHVRAYFENGTLPEKGTICNVDLPPFRDRNVVSNHLSPEQEILLSNLRELSATIDYARGRRL